MFPCRLYHITLWTFLLALGHFLSELFIFGTAAPTVGVLAPLMVASKHRATLDPFRVGLVQRTVYWAGKVLFLSIMNLFCVFKVSQSWVC